MQTKIPAVYSFIINHTGIFVHIVFIVEQAGYRVTAKAKKVLLKTRHFLSLTNFSKRVILNHDNRKEIVLWQRFGIWAAIKAIKRNVLFIVRCFGS